MWRKCILKFFFLVRKIPPDITSDIFNSGLGEHQMLSNCTHDGDGDGALSSPFLVEEIKAENTRLSTAIRCLHPEEPLSHSFPTCESPGK